jgi:lysozyme
MIRALIAVLLALALAAAPAQAFTNGHAATGDLSQVTIPHNTAELAKPAAAAWNTMRMCAVREGVDLYPSPSQFRPAATAYRTYREQLILWRLYKSGRGNLAAVPGTSNHGLGHAVDLAQTRMRTWVDHHGAAFGWRKVEAFSEWWHVNYVGGFNRPDPGRSLRFPNLRRGSGGACQAQAVRELQRRLGLKGDGEYGKGTGRAVRAFQRAHGLHPDGVVGSDTWLRLRKVSRGLHRDPRDVQQVPGQKAPMAGADVRAIQGLLNARLLELHRPQYRVKVTGVFDAATRTAVARFQRLRHLKVTGAVDDATYAQLLKTLAPPSRKPHVTTAGVNLVADFEGFRSCPYRDVVGVWTIGFGHTAHVGPSSRCLSRRQALELLHRDLDLFAIGVTRLVRVKLSDATFSAIVSFSYNVGLGALGGSTLLRELNAGHRRAACDQLLRWDRAGGRVFEGLARRRRAERELCLR